MNIKKGYIVFALSYFLAASYTDAQAQDKKLKKADKQYNEFAFVEAAKLYEGIVERGDASVDVYTKLGNCYYYNGDYAKATEPYAKVFETGKSIDDEYYFRYAQALNSSQKYDEAAAVMRKYYNATGKKDKADSWVKSKRDAEIQKQSGRYAIQPVSINTPASDFGTAFCGKDKVIYTSARDTGVVFKRKSGWNDKAFLKLYAADVDANGGLTNYSKLKGDINTQYHQSSPAITKDGKTMYFTRNNFMDGKLSGDKKGVSHLKIYVAQNIKGEWKNIQPLPYPINSDAFSTAHPALSMDETQLYFASDRDNKFGNTDLYVVSLKKGGIIGNDVTRLSDEINTPGKETFPSVDANGVLYFASDGHPGLGGLDVFAAMKDADGVYQVVNLGDGVNSEADDFAYITKNGAKTGFFSSNRSGNDDIYSYTESKPVAFSFEYRPLAYGTILEDGKPVTNLKVEIFNDKEESVGITQTDKDGKYSIYLDPFQHFKAVYTKSTLAGKTLEIEPMQPLEKRDVSFELVKEIEVIVEGEVVKISSGDDLTKKLKLNPIYFDFNGFNIRKSSKKELDKIIELMRDRPTITIKVNSYTDSRGRDDFNMKLSQNRADATVKYIASGGIDKGRLSGEGFGETHLLNNCDNGSKCTDKEHEVNRRSEFIISFN